MLKKQLINILKTNIKTNLKTKHITRWIKKFLIKKTIKFFWVWIIQDSIFFFFSFLLLYFFKKNLLVYLLKSILSLLENELLIYNNLENLNELIDECFKCESDEDKKPAAIENSQQNQPKEELRQRVENNEQKESESSEEFTGNSIGISQQDEPKAKRQKVIGYVEGLAQWTEVAKFPTPGDEKPSSDSNDSDSSFDVETIGWEKPNLEMQREKLLLDLNKKIEKKNIQEAVAQSHLDDDSLTIEERFFWKNQKKEASAEAEDAANKIQIILSLDQNSKNE